MQLVRKPSKYLLFLPTVICVIKKLLQGVVSFYRVDLIEGINSMATIL